MTGAVTVEPAPIFPISLYLEIEVGKKADLEVIGKAAVAFVAAVREAAFILDPSMEVRLDFASGTEGSLFLNTLIKRVGKAVKPDRKTIISLGLIVMGWFANDIRTYGVIRFLDHYLPTEERQKLSEEDISRIAHALKDAMDGKIAKEPVKRVYRELERRPLRSPT